MHSAGGQSRPPLQGELRLVVGADDSVGPLGSCEFAEQFCKKQVQTAGSMCTGKRQSHIRNAPSSRTAVAGIDPYEAYKYSARRFELFQISRERSKKTEAVFLVGSRRAGGKSKSLRASNCKPAKRLQFEEEEPDSEDKRLREQRGARSGEAGSDESAFSFGEAKENADGQLLISNMSSNIVKRIVDHKILQIRRSFS